MKFLKKFVTGNLIVGFILFAGSFCIHSMVAQAASEDMAMGTSPSQNNSDTNDGGCIAQSNDAVSDAVTCVSHCITEAPQAVVAKKTSTDTVSNVFALIPHIAQPQFSEPFLNPLDVTGTDPLSPDILSSVVKKE
ncbi:MAG TPA: hypothetical protein VJH89_02360 [Patescibacteria group bacterium]|nr:hypothetical protein [Patescibacteria group bacterium]